MTEGITVSIVVVVMFVSSAYLIYRYLDNRHRERMKYLESGGDLSELLQAPGREKWPVKLGVICCGLAIGLLVGYLMEMNISSMQAPLPYLFSILLFTGISLIVYYILFSRHEL